MNHARIYAVVRRLSGYGLGIGLVFVVIGAGLAILGHRVPGAVIGAGGIIVSMQFGILCLCCLWSKYSVNPGSRPRPCDDLIDRR